MNSGWRGGETGRADVEAARRLLLRRLSEANDRMAAAEPGTDDFIDAYVESRALQDAYRRVRGRWWFPAEVRRILPDLDDGG